MKKLHLTALLSFVLCHFLFLFIFLFDADHPKFGEVLSYVVWATGIVAGISNLIFAEKIGLKKWLLLVFGLSSIVWFFPLVVITYFGIPMAILFFAIGVYVHAKHYNIVE